MSVLMFVAMMIVLIFVFGFYLGNQIGRTEHIRKRLQELRQDEAS